MQVPLKNCWEGVVGNLSPSKALPEDLNRQFRQKFYHDCLRCVNLNALYGFNGVHESKYSK